MSDLAVTMLWPLAAVVLVLCGATFATSGRSSDPANTDPASGRSSDPAIVGAASRAGRRATDRLPGDRMMVVIAGGDSHDTVRSAVDAARRAGTGVTIIGDVPTAASTYGRLGSIDRLVSDGTRRVYG